MQRETTVSKTAAARISINLKTPSTHFIAGRVLEEGSGRPISEAYVYLEVNRGSGRTDPQGYFRFPARGDSLDRIEATISHSKYETFRGGLVLSERNGPVLLRIRQ